MVTMQSSLRDMVDIEHGEISREVFVNEEIYQQELEQIFARSWLFVGHESQVPNAGDYFQSRMGTWLSCPTITRDPAKNCARSRSWQIVGHASRAPTATVATSCTSS